MSQTNEIVNCSVALLYQRGNHQQVMATLVPYVEGDTIESLKDAADQYHRERVGDGLEGFTLMAWGTAILNKR